MVKKSEFSKKEELVPLFRIIDKEFRRDFERRLSEYDLTAQQGRLLFYINWNNKEGNKVRQVDIEKHFQLTKSTVHGLIDRMEKANLVNKEKEENKQYIVITEDCKKILEEVFSRRLECLNKMTEGLSDEEINTLHSLLMKIYENRDKGGND
jgi:DNA-binding MarR family transcriptional regulator